MAVSLPEPGGAPAESFLGDALSIVVLGASGDLAKKKTYPSLLDLHVHGFLPKDVNIVGYARSANTDEAFREHLKPYLQKEQRDAAKIDAFLQCCTYFQGQYGSVEDFARLAQELEVKELATEKKVANRLFYFAIPPDAFLASAKSIKASAMTESGGFTRLIVEKPFGHDLASAQQLVSDLSSVLSEDHIYRIDHYLGKELVQNLLTLRFANSLIEPTLNKNYVASIRITFEEDFGTEGRGGYFTNYGIIRDVIQNHLMQVLSLVAMEAPPKVVGKETGNYIRDAKNNALRTISPIDPEEVVVGQYIGAGGKPGYLEDDSIAEKDREKAKLVPTFAQCILHVNTPRWHGVPFIVKAGKALTTRKAEVRIQFKDAPASEFMFGTHCPRNELVMRLQPDEAIYVKVNVKTPGLVNAPTQSELDLSYGERYREVYNPSAYTRLILEALRGNQENFVRSDELLESWRLFSPLLEKLEAEGRVPLPYEYGTRGPKEADDMLAKFDFVHDKDYKWRAPECSPTGGD
eukprot:TRINITY_DN62940_c0_g1_i1.p1 TRINITY_DN62940_c0_g1~~TRINITY_DN62940_c0_g1_i1.p1  ORF type:complete len:536 (+),score=107.90 TRINITY_DN62940_c0_g1_i1:50-1609(+)